MAPDSLAAAPSTMSIQRVFLMAGVTFVVGSAAGGLFGYSAGAAAETSAVAAPAVAPAPQLPSTGDADLDELRRLAVKAPIEELLEQRLVFLANMSREYRGDQILWRGFDRLVEVVLHGEGVSDDRLLGRLLAQIIEFGDPDFRTPRLPLAPRLRQVK